MKRLDFSDEEQFFPPLTLLFLLLLLVLLGTVLGAALVLLLHYGQEQDFSQLVDQLGPTSSSGQRNRVRWTLLLSHLSTFLLPPLFLAIFIFRRHWAVFLQLDWRPRWRELWLGSWFIVAGLPLAQFFYWLNRQAPLPDWARSMEADSNNLLQNLLVNAEPYELIFNILLLAVVPAVGEELVFRGVLQKQLHRYFARPEWAIWLTAFIFSAIHFQFEGFLPRMILGAMLGYLLYWTQNLWIPILAHFLNNGLQILAQYLHQKDLSNFNPDQVDGPHWALSIFSLILVLILGHYLSRGTAENRP